MSRGGARANSGPAPDPMSFRTYQRRASGESIAVAPGWIVLPVTGRPGTPPECPLMAATDRELVLWNRLWATPQASEWERLGQEFEVALYVRRLAEVELPGTSAALGGLVLRMGEALGLTLAGLRANRWQIGSQDGPPASVTAIGAAPTTAQSFKRRLSAARDRFVVSEEWKDD